MHFVKDGDLRRVNAGEAFGEPLVLRLVVDEERGPVGVAGARLLVGLPRRQGGRIATKTESAVTDDRGLLSFTPPPPDFVGKAKLTVRLDSQSAFELLDALPAAYASEVAALEDGLRSLGVELPYEVLSRARAVPTAVLIADLGDEGAVVLPGLTQAAPAELLSKEGFDLRPSGLSADSIPGRDDPAILGDARKAADGYARLIYGSARLSRLSKDGSNWIGEARASVKVVDLASGAVLWVGEKAAAAVSPDEASARMAALRELGLNAIGQDLLSALP